MDVNTCRLYNEGSLRLSRVQTVMAALRTLLLALAGELLQHQLFSRHVNCVLKHLFCFPAGFPCSRTSECSYFGLLDHLNMTTSNQALKISRPVKNWTSTTLVQLDMVLDGILDMVSVLLILILL